MYNARISKRTLLILEHLATERQPLGVSQIAAALSINKSTAYGILKALEEEGYVTKDEVQKKYAAGHRLFRLSKLALGESDLALLARPFLRKLAAVADETAFLGVREGEFMKVVTVVEAQRTLRISSQEGVKLPLIAGAFGKAYLSAMSEGEMLELLGQIGLQRFTEKSIQHVGFFLDEIKKAKKLGFAPDVDEYVGGIAALAAPITSGDEPVGAVWLAGFTAALRNWNLFTVVRCLIETARGISTAIDSSAGYYYGSNASEASRENLRGRTGRKKRSPGPTQSQQSAGARTP
jgi:IclR family transcriptional regulator, KDG regulon repressor